MKLTRLNCGAFKCISCKWWRVDEKDLYHEIISPCDPVTYDQEDTEEAVAKKWGHVVRFCHCPDVLFYQRPRPHQATVVDGSEYQARLITGGEFGCTLYEPAAPDES